MIIGNEDLPCPGGYGLECRGEAYVEERRSVPSLQILPKLRCFCGRQQQRRLTGLQKVLEGHSDTRPKITKGKRVDYAKECWDNKDSS